MDRPISDSRVDSFGLAAPAFFAGVARRALRARLVAFRLARQLGCERATSGVGGLLGVAGAASLGEIYRGIDLPLRGASLASAASVSWFLERLARRRKPGACAARAGRDRRLRCCATNPPSSSRRCCSQWRCYEVGFALSASAWARAARRIAPIGARRGSTSCCASVCSPMSAGRAALYAGSRCARAAQCARADRARVPRGRRAWRCSPRSWLAGGVALRRAGGAGARPRAGRAAVSRSGLALALLPSWCCRFAPRASRFAIETPLALLVALALESLVRGVACHSQHARSKRRCWRCRCSSFRGRPLLERGRHPEGELPRRLIALIAARGVVAGPFAHRGALRRRRARRSRGRRALPLPHLQRSARLRR